MRALCTALSAALVVVLLATSAAAADLPEPKVNDGATQVRIDGTRVTSEAWALAKGHDVDSIVVTRLKVRDGKPHKVESYERWSRDGKTKFERGSRALGRQWEKHLWAVLEEGAAGKKDRRKRKELMRRALDQLGPKGQREIDGYVVAWTLVKGVHEDGSKPSRARIAIFTYTPSGAAVTPPSKDPKKPGATTPRDPKAKKDGKKPDAKERPLRETPTTPRAGPDKRWPFPIPKPGRGGGSGFSSGSGSGQVTVDSEKGVREHARVTVDLGRLLPKPAPEPKKPSGPVTPKAR